MLKFATKNIIMANVIVELHNHTNKTQLLLNLVNISLIELTFVLYEDIRFYVRYVTISDVTKSLSFLN